MNNIFKPALGLIQQWLDSRRSYVFVGPPASGKTVYFVTATDRLQRFAHEHSAQYEFTHRTPETLQFCQHALEQMNASEWPSKTQGLQVLEFELSKSFRLSDNTPVLYKTHYELSYCDCAGEAFDEAFGDQRVQGNGLHHEQAEHLKKEISGAHGIFVMIDTPKFHDKASTDFHMRLFNLFKHIQTSTKAKRIAVVFTKKDEFAAKDFDPKQKLKSDLPSAWNHLGRVSSEFFFVSAVKAPKINEMGRLVPPENYDTTQSENLLEPLKWMLSI